MAKPAKTKTKKQNLKKRVVKKSKDKPDVQKEDNSLVLEKAEDGYEVMADVSGIFGISDAKLATLFIGQTLGTFRGYQSSEGYNEKKLPGIFDNAISLIRGIAPRDEIENMLAIQMIGVHNMAMNAIRLAMISDQFGPAKETNVNQATKLLRTFIAQMDALKKYRTGGQQKVVVEHVHVNEGGQAIVGNVTKGGVGSDEEKSK